MDKRHSILCVRPRQCGGYEKRGSVRVRFHPTTMKKASALAQLTHPTLPHYTLVQSPVDPLPTSPWSCRNSSSSWAMEANFQMVTGVSSFPQLAGAGEGELEEWEVIDPDRVRLGYRATRWVDVKCEQGVACLCWQLAAGLAGDSGDKFN